MWAFYWDFLEWRTWLPLEIVLACGGAGWAGACEELAEV